MNNPFESGHIKNYVLLYSSVVVIMVLFFVASTLFNDVQNVDKKVFDTNGTDLSNQEDKRVMKNIMKIDSSNFKMMPKSY